MALTIWLWHLGHPAGQGLRDLARLCTSSRHGGFYGSSAPRPSRARCSVATHAFDRHRPRRALRDRGRPRLHRPHAHHRFDLGTAGLGSVWAWDARLTSTAILGVLALGYFALRRANDDFECARAAARLRVVAAINVPIDHFSVSGGTRTPGRDVSSVRTASSRSTAACSGHCCSASSGSDWRTYGSYPRAIDSSAARDLGTETLEVALERRRAEGVHHGLLHPRLFLCLWGARALGAVDRWRGDRN